jgi:hypothetical protein
MVAIPATIMALVLLCAPGAAASFGIGLRSRLPRLHMVHHAHLRMADISVLALTGHALACVTPPPNRPIPVP